MADKTTTLKTKTDDNVYPNVIGDNRKNAFVDSSTITHHFYDQTHKVGFQIANETNIKIQNSLQKPAGLTKTKLVGVGTNGQENIEIGDNLTLANGKLSATVGDSGGREINILEGTITNAEGYIGGTYTGNIDINKINILHLPEFQDLYILLDAIYNVGNLMANGTILSGTDIMNVEVFGGDFQINYVNLYSNHFITLTSENDKIYFQYLNSHENRLDADMADLISELSGKKVLCTGVLGNSDETLATPLYVSGEAGGLEVYYILKNDTSGTISSKSVTSFEISDLVKPVR